MRECFGSVVMLPLMLVLAFAAIPGMAQSPSPQLPSGPGGALSGSAKEAPAAVASALAAEVYGGAGGGVGIVILSDQPDGCDLRAQRKMIANARRLHLVLAEREGGGTTPPIEVGTFPVNSEGESRFADAWIEAFGPDCKEIQKIDAVRGFVRLKRLPDKRRGLADYAGFFELDFGTKGKLKGTFRAPVCAAVSHGVDKEPDFSPPTCQTTKQ